MKTVLVTGGAGFIGSNFVHHLMDTYPDYRILVLDALTYAGSLDNLPIVFDGRSEQYAFWYGNVANGSLVDSLVEQSQCIVHFAAETHVTRSIYDNNSFFETDVLGTQTIANAVCKHRESVEKFIHVSTSEVYGTAVGAQMDEDHPLNPASPYAAAKAGADRLVYSYWYTYKIPVVIIRPFNNYGPRQHLEKLVPRFITNSILNHKLRIHGGGVAARDFVHVTDTCKAIDLAMHSGSETDGQVFNVGSGLDRTVVDIANDVLSYFRIPTGSRETQLEYVGDRPGQVLRHTANCEKIKKTLGWSTQVDWNAGLIDTIKWYMNNKHHWERQMWLRDVLIITASGKREFH